MKQHYHLKGFLLGILSLISTIVSAYDFKVNGIYYNLDTTAKTASVTYSSSYYSGAVTIPSTITYYGTTYSVTSIGNNAFMRCHGLTSVTIPNSVKSIEYGAFSYCSGLTSIDIPKSVTSILATAFYGCTSLTSVTIGKSVTSIGESAFYDCSGLKKVIVKDIAAWCKIKFSSNVTSNPLYYAHHLFSDLNTEITKLIIPNGVTSIGNYAFYGCSGLTAIEIPSSVTSIGDGAFHNCSSLSSVVIPNSVTNIGQSAFYNCSGLTSVSIGNSVISIGWSAFSGCSGLKKVIVKDIAAWCKINFSSDLSSVTSNPLYYAHHLFSDLNTEITKLIIPNGVTSIGEYAFAYCSGLTSITIPNSVTTIGENAFSYCTGLTSVTIPNSVTSIGGRAFQNCTCLTDVTINSNAILSKDYSASSNLKDIFGSQVTKYVIGTNVTSIGNYVFYGFTGLTSLKIGNGVTSIGSFAFWGCSGLTSVTIPNSVTSIGNSAFNGCSGLTSIVVDGGNSVYDSRNNCNAIIETASNTLVAGCKSTAIPNSVTSIGEGAFYGCTGLASVDIPNSVTTIGSSAFYGCSSLTSVTIGKSVTSIGESAFSGCSGLKKVIVKDIAAWCKIYFSSNSSNVTSNPLYYAHHLFSDLNTEITKLIIPNGVTSIGNYAFVTCSGLTSVTIPNSVTSIGQYAFSGCSGLISTTSTSISTGIYLETGSSFSFTLTHNNKSIAVLKSGYIKFTGLDPMQDYTIKGVGLSGKTKELIFTTLQPKVISAGNAVVAAESNLDDEETNVGFEWRRTDWTDDFASNLGIAYLYNGTMEGYIRNLYTEKLWKYRPFYTSNAGNTYYGDWVGIDPTNTSYFEPTVHTYANVSVNGNSAEVKGYVQRGTDNVVSKGFAYWEQSQGVKSREAMSAPSKISSLPSYAKTVEVSGSQQVMTASLSNLEYETTYCYVAFVRTSEGDTFYGEEMTFTSGESPYNLGDVNGDKKIDISDVVGMVNYILGNTPSTSFKVQAADINKDGNIDISDVVALVNMILG